MPTLEASATEATPTPITAVPGRAHPSLELGGPLLNTQQAVFDRIRYGGMWVLMGRVGGIVATVTLNIILARILAPTDFGRCVLIMSIVSSAVVLGMFGMNGALLRLVSESVGLRDGARARQVLRKGSIISLVTAPCVALATSFCVWLLFGAHDLLPAVFIGGIVMLVAWQQIAAEVLRSLHDQRLANLFSGGQTGGALATYLFIGLLLVSISVSVPSLTFVLFLNVLALACTLPIALFSLSFVSRRKLVGELSDAGSVTIGVSTGDILKLGATLTTIQLLVFLTTQADIWIAGLQFSAGDVALYAAARRFVTLVAIPAQLVNLTVAPTLAELYSAGKREDLQKVLRTAASAAFLITFAAFIGLALAGGFTVSLVFGSWYRDANGLLMVLCVGQVVASWCACSGYALVMTGRQNAELAITLFSTITLAVLGPLAGHYVGPYGVAWAATFCIAMKALAEWHALHRHSGLHANPPLRLALTNLSAAIRRATFRSQPPTHLPPSLECSRVRRPNLFLVGAPRCASAPLQQYLELYPTVSFCDPDASNDSTDEFAALRVAPTLRSYMRLLQGEADAHAVIVDASPIYLYDPAAATRIFEINPAAKILVLLRNPIDLATSWHAELYASRDESIDDFITAFRNSAKPRTGRDRPAESRCPGLLDYAQVGSMHAALSEWLKTFPPEQLKIVLLEELAQSPAKVCAEIAQFMGVRFDPMLPYPAIPDGREARIRFPAYLLERSQDWLIRAGIDWRHALGVKDFGMAKLASRRRRPKPLSPELRDEVAAAYRHDVSLLAQMIPQITTLWPDFGPDVIESHPEQTPLGAGT